MLRNILVTPIVIFVRMAVLGTLLIINKIGDVAGSMFDALKDVIPGWEVQLMEYSYGTLEELEALEKAERQRSRTN